MNLSNQQQEQLIKNILADTILIERINEGMIQMSKAHDTLRENFDGFNYKGFDSLYLLLGVDNNQDLKSKLITAYEKHFDKGLEENQTVVQMAEHIIIDWKLIIEIDKIDNTPLPKM